MENPPIILGEAPSKSGDRYHAFPCSGAVAELLCKMAGIAPLVGESRYGQWTWALYDHFECENLIERWPGPQGRGSAFPDDVARPLAKAFAKNNSNRVVVLLGARLRDLMIDEQFGKPGFYSWCPRMVVRGAGEIVLSPAMVVAIPHPSGLNRTLNDPAERERCGEVLREAMARARMLERV